MAAGFPGGHEPRLNAGVSLQKRIIGWQISRGIANVAVGCLDSGAERFAPGVVLAIEIEPGLERHQIGHVAGF